jgi:hypothetical protein
MSNLTYYILIEVDIQNNMITPENMKEAISKIPEGYKLEVLNPQVDIIGNKAKIIFACVEMKDKRLLY